MTREDRLAELLVRWEEATGGGRSPTLEDLCRDCPELLPEFRDLLARLGPVNALLEGDEPPRATPEELVPHLDGARYRPLSFHRQGGLGLLFLAEDAELRRIVALKCLQALAAADADARERFVREAEVTGKLEHPGVVPVYGLGSDGEGRPYYAMRFIHGATLREAAEQHHSPAGPDGPAARNVEFQRLLRAFVTVCETVAYAHSRGVVHRDLKPDNVMLGPYGETLVLDWGLAKCLDRPEPAGPQAAETPLRLALRDGESRSVLGRAKGSPAYMSPEQARGEWDAVGPASDVYSLGATLYFLLTGRTPYTGRSAAEVIERVKAGGCAPPREVRPGVPAALDAVCRKAMAASPEDRYPDVRKLAQDVERWLADEPVAVWREPLAVRAWRWLKRHRTLVTGAVAALVVALAGLGVLAGQQHRANEQLNGKNRELEEANERERGLHDDVEKRRDETRAQLYLSNINLAPRAREEGQGERVRELLREVMPQRPGEKDLRGFEWRYLWRLSHADRLTLAGHGAWVNGIAYVQPGGRSSARLASVGNDKTARVWDPDTGKELLTLRHPSNLNAVAFSPDGKRLACGCWDRTVVVWDARAGKELFTLRGHGQVVTSVCFSPDGKQIVSGSYDRIVRVWDATTGRQTLALPEHPGGVNDVAFSPDGRLLASAGKGVKLWDVRTRQEVRSLDDLTGSVQCLSFSPDGTFLAAGGNRTLRVWKAQTGEKVVAPVLATIPRRLSFHPDGKRLAVACEDQTVKILDAGTGRRLCLLVGHTAPVRCVAFRPDGKSLSSGGQDRVVKVWDLAAAEEAVTLAVGPFASLRNVTAVAFTPDSRLLAAASDSSEIKLWRVETGREIRAFRGHEVGAAHALSFSPNGERLASAGGDRTVRIWDVGTGREIHRLGGHTGGVYGGVAFSPDGRLLASGGDRKVKLWDAASGKELLALSGHTGFICAVAFSPDGRHVASGGVDGTVRVWDVTGGRERRRLRGHSGPVYALAYSSDGALLAAGGGERSAPGEVKVWDPASGQEVRALRGHSMAVRGVCFSPDGRRLASGSADLGRELGTRQLKVWDLATGKELFSPRDGLRIWALAFSPDGRRLAAGCAGNFVRIWDAGGPAP
jgi:WD40 repeat protein